MTRTPFIQPRAQAELDAAADWYDEQDATGRLRKRLLNEVEETLNVVCATPTLFAEYDHTTRRALLRRFPYALYYEVEPTRIVVVAFMHMKREPR